MKFLHVSAFPPATAKKETLYGGLNTRTSFPKEEHSTWAP